jgi:hypothetical protein
VKFSGVFKVSTAKQSDNIENRSASAK